MNDFKQEKYYESSTNEQMEIDSEDLDECMSVPKMTIKVETESVKQGVENKNDTLTPRASTPISCMIEGENEAIPAVEASEYGTNTLKMPSAIQFEARSIEAGPEQSTEEAIVIGEYQYHTVCSNINQSQVAVTYKGSKLTNQCTAMAMYFLLSKFMGKKINCTQKVDQLIEFGNMLYLDSRYIVQS